MSRRPFEPDQLLALLLGDIGRSLVRASELLSGMQARSREPDEMPPLARAMLEDSKPMDGNALLETVREMNRTPKTAFRAREIEFPVPQKPLDLSTADEMIIGTTARKILTALAQLNRSLSIQQIGIYTALSNKGGSFQAALRGLVNDGLVDKDARSYVITEPGRVALGDYAELPLGEPLFEFWCAKFGETSEKILRALRREPDSVSLLELGASTGLAHGGGSFQAALRALRKLELVTKHAGEYSLSVQFRRAIAPTINVFDGKKTHKLDAHKGHAR